MPENIDPVRLVPENIDPVRLVPENIKPGRAVPESVDQPPSGPPPAIEPDKATRRALLLARRRGVPADVRRREAHQLARGALAACSMVGLPVGATVCAYVPVGSEPGSSGLASLGLASVDLASSDLASSGLVEALHASGRRVLLPIVPDGPGPSVGRAAGSADPVPSPPLGWAAYQGVESLVAGPHGMRQPAGPDLGPAAIADASLILVPALAVDRQGVRLGRGAGWYDRSLPLARPGTPLLAVVRDEEVVLRLSREPHDALVTGALTPTAGPQSFRPPADSTMLS